MGFCDQCPIVRDILALGSVKCDRIPCKMGTFNPMLGHAPTAHKVGYQKSWTPRTAFSARSAQLMPDMAVRCASAVTLVLMVILHVPGFVRKVPGRHPVSKPQGPTIVLHLPPRHDRQPNAEATACEKPPWKIKRTASWGRSTWRTSPNKTDHSCKTCIFGADCSKLSTISTLKAKKGYKAMSWNAHIYGCVPHTRSMQRDVC